MRIKNINYGAWLVALSIMIAAAGCKKVEYTTINNPAYVRVFNDLNYTQNYADKLAKYPDLCMIINPVLAADGTPTGGDVIADFLDKRAPYAPPYPSHSGNSTSLQNPEYPGKANVLVGPILNGFDLSSWAQMPSGKLRFMFFYRPYNEIPFFQLDRQLQQDVLLDTTLNLDAQEVYTLHVLQRDYVTKKKGVILRKETFQKLPLADTLAYVNFYNYSSKGYWQADESQKPTGGANLLRSFKSGVKDEMNIYMSIYNGQVTPVSPTNSPVITNYDRKYIGRLIRDADGSQVNPYVSFPIWVAPKADSIKTDIWQRFDFLAPGLDIMNTPYRVAGNNTNYSTYGNFAAVNCLLNGTLTTTTLTANTYFQNATMVPNMLVNIASGTQKSKTFATVNTIEVINSNVYLMTVQRKYPAPTY